MTTSDAVRDGRAEHWFQRLLDSIPFLVLLGVLFPTGLYTLWSVLELRGLPHFGDAPPGALHGRLEPTAAVNAADAPREDGVVVAMRGMAFVPTVLEVGAGTTVTWVNEDPFDHAVAYGTPDTPAGERLFADSGDFPAGERFSYTFTEAGSHDIYCSTVGHYAAGMTMTVIVAEERR